MTDTDIPAGLDVETAVEGTYIGAHDNQGTDGETRTDRPGEILGTVIADAKAEARTTELAKHDYVRAEVDRANREELPKLGGDIADTWAPDAKAEG